MHIRKYLLAVGPAALLLAGVGGSAEAQTRDTQAQGQHVVSPEELHRDAARPTQTRQTDAQAVRDLLETPEGQEALRRAKVDYARVDKAMAQVSDADLAKFGERSRQAKADFAAGGIGSRLLIVVILIIVLAIVLAVVF
jgi:hypothetical protein